VQTAQWSSGMIGKKFRRKFFRVLGTNNFAVASGLKTPSQEENCDRPRVQIPVEPNELSLETFCHFAL
jgi:hypothetical protein